MVTGALLFAPIAVWMIYVCIKLHAMTVKARYHSREGIVGHIILAADRSLSRLLQQRALG
jgi:hypothetical protein